MIGQKLFGRSGDKDETHFVEVRGCDCRCRADGGDRRSREHLAVLTIDGKTITIAIGPATLKYGYAVAEVDTGRLP
jgi:hypothetical protein